MSTPKQIAANRQNSQKSTGPRSAQGKAASRANSLKTGLYARSQVIAGEDPAELRALAGQYFLRWDPVTPEESFLVATLVDSDWPLRRYSLADAKIWDYQGADDSVRDNPNGMGLNFIRCREYFPLLQRRTDSAQRSFHRALHDLERLQTKRPATTQSTPTPVADPPPEAKPNSAQPQSAQQRIGFVPSFSPAPDSASPKPVQAAVPNTVTHPNPTQAGMPVPRGRRMVSMSLAARTFLCGCLLAWPALSAVPAPSTYFGHEIGADKTVLDWDKVVGYFQALAKSSDRIKVEELGKTADGRPFIAATIADPDTLRHLDRYIAIQQKLADPRKTTQAEAEQLILQGKTVVLITCSIHATEIASTHTAVEFAWRLLTEDTPHHRAIFKDTIVLLVPSQNPDGVDIVTRWYRKTLGTPYEGTSPPELYHKYVGHDNNRDWYIFSQPETRLTVGKLHNVWHPEITYDVHQMGGNGARLFVPPWLDPTEPNIDAILMQEMNMMGTAMATALTAEGKTGVAIHGVYDFWTPSRHYMAFHAGLRLLTESASARIASPMTMTKDQISENALGYNPRERSWNYLEPWMGGAWRLRDIIDYQLIAWDACLYNAAIHREELLRNFYRVGVRQVARTEPWGFVISSSQADPGATRKMIETLRFGQVEVGKGADGSAVVSMHQPYGGWAKSLLERQHYPEDRLYPGGPPKRPYDVTANTLPLLMGVDVKTVDRPVPFSGEWQAPPAAAGPVLKASDTDSWMAVNRAWKSGEQVCRDPATGDFSTSRAGWKELKQPRVALYQPWTGNNMDEGWTRWLLEQFGFAYTTVHNRDIQAGDLRKKFDVIVFADQPTASIENGQRNMPEEYTGGIGAKSADLLKEFANAGGTLVFLNGASQYAVTRLGVQARLVTPAAGRGGRGGDTEPAPEANRVSGSSEFYSPGSLLNAKIDTHSPLAYGVPAEIAIWSEQSPAWDTQLPVVARYPDSGVLASGWLVGEKVIAGKAALIDAPMGSGHVVLFGMRPQYRAQSYLTFKMFFNALVY